jgi:gas vesicle protein
MMENIQQGSERNMAKVKGKDFVVGAVVGGVLGAVTALLFAPKPGKELRADISDQVHTTYEKTQELAKAVGSTTSQWVGKAKDTGSAVVDEIRSWKVKRSSSSAETDENGEMAAISQYNENEDYLNQAENI